MTERLFAKLRELEQKTFEGWRTVAEIYNSDSIDGGDRHVGYNVMESIDYHEFRKELKAALPKIFEVLDLYEAALDKYTSNPELWDKSKDEWYAVHAVAALKRAKELGR